jgi:protein arginine kinase activator
MKKCEECGENEATVHFTEIEGEEKREINLCEGCARNKSIPSKAISLADILSNLLSQVSAKEMGEMSNIACPNCGITYSEFRAAGRFGCPTDYEVFRKGLSGLIEKIQHDTRHVGKVPPQAGKVLVQQNELIRLRHELERAAQAEEFEKAAQLRDRIAEISRSISEDC